MFKVATYLSLIFLCTGFQKVGTPLKKIEIFLTKDSDSSTFSIGKTDKTGTIKTLLSKDYYTVRISDGKKKKMNFKPWVKVSSSINGNPISISIQVEESENKMGFAVHEQQIITISVYKQ